MRLLAFVVVLFVSSSPSRSRAEQSPAWLEEVPAARLSYVRRLRHFDGLAVSFGGDAQGNRMICVRSSPTLRTCHLPGFGLRAPGVVALVAGMSAIGGGLTLTLMSAFAPVRPEGRTELERASLYGGILAMALGVGIVRFGSRHIARHRRGLAWMHARHATLVPTADAASGGGGASLALDF